jgi:hypothetical protein
MSKFTPKPEDVRTLRIVTDIGMFEAKRRLRREKMLTELDDLRGDWIADREKFDRLLDVVEEMLRDPL